MTTHVKVICDACGANLSAELNHPSYYLNLMSSYRCESAREDGMVPLPTVVVKDPVPSTMHFCNLKCLQIWVSSESRE